MPPTPTPFDNQVVLVTGGTGSFGKSFVKFLLAKTQASKIIVFSRDEFKQFHMQREVADPKLRMRYFLGDVRDLPRLQRALNGVDIVIHAAALKQVPTLEYNPMEAVKTNVLGSENVVEAALDKGVKKVLLVSSDKAVQPVNLYGATKLCAERIFIAANNYGAGKAAFSVVRYGNVVGSRGSIVETLLASKRPKTVHITHADMTRFWLTLPESHKLVQFAVDNMEGGEIFIPDIPSMKVVDLFKVLAPRAKQKIVGIRPGEKIHESLFTEHEAKRAHRLEKYFVILPDFIPRANLYLKYLEQNKKLAEPTPFNSDTNQAWLTKSDFQKIIKKIQLA